MRPLRSPALRNAQGCVFVRFCAFAWKKEKNTVKTKREGWGPKKAAQERTQSKRVGPLTYLLGPACGKFPRFPEGLFLGIGVSTRA